jgi:hypothetical protein
LLKAAQETSLLALKGDMMRKTSRFVVLASLLLALLGTPLLAEKPNFSPVIWGDGELWGTKVVTVLPTPNEHARNQKSFDKFFVIVNSNNDSPQLPVSEAAPRNPHYNGGRWSTHTVVWTQEGFDAHGVVPILTSYDEVMFHYSLGHLTITAGSPLGGPPLYFLCPLLPVK